MIRDNISNVVEKFKPMDEQTLACVFKYIPQASFYLSSRKCSTKVIRSLGLRCRSPCLRYSARKESNFQFVHVSRNLYIYAGGLYAQVNVHSHP